MSPRRHVLAIRSTSSAGGPLISVELLSSTTGLHPDVIARLIALGAVEPAGGTRLVPLFEAEAASRLARITRLRRDLGLNYAGALLAEELISRVEALEALLDRSYPPDGGD